MKFLGVTLTKYIQDVKVENYKMLKMEIKECLVKRDTQCSLTRRFYLVKRSILSKLIYRFNAVPIKIPGRFCRYY